jgi:hypothetical protein
VKTIIRTYFHFIIIILTIVVLIIIIILRNTTIKQIIIITETIEIQLIKQKRFIYSTPAIILAITILILIKITFKIIKHQILKIIIIILIICKNMDFIINKIK